MNTISTTIVEPSPNALPMSAPQPLAAKMPSPAAFASIEVAALGDRRRSAPRRSPRRRAGRPSSTTPCTTVSLRLSTNPSVTAGLMWQPDTWPIVYAIAEQRETERERDAEVADLVGGDDRAARSDQHEDHGADDLRRRDTDVGLSRR